MSTCKFGPTLRDALIANGYCDSNDGLDDGRRSIYQKNGYLETRANAKEAWEWLKSIGAHSLKAPPTNPNRRPNP